MGDETIIDNYKTNKPKANGCILALVKFFMIFIVSIFLRQLFIGKKRFHYTTKKQYRAVWEGFSLNMSKYLISNDKLVAFSTISQEYFSERR